MDEIKRLYRSRNDRMIFGVCGGLGQYFGIDSLVFRGLFLLFSFGGGAGILVYLLMAILIPVEPIGHEHYAPHFEAKEKINEFAQAVKTGAQNLAQEMKSSSHSNSRKGLVGIILVAFGCLFLLNTLFPQAWVRWDIFWPVVLILVGVFIITKKR